MNKIFIKPHIPEGGFILPSSESYVYVTILLFHSLPDLSLSTMLTESDFHDYSNERGTLHILRWVAGTGVNKYIQFQI